MSNALSERLLSWYRHNARDLPWRRTRDPYAIWVAEVMLQQTRVETVLPYYQRWMDRFPGPKALAEADSDELMSAWEGLGYYRRARLLQRAAKRILTDHNGNVPRNLDDLRSLPGVGKYTAAAVGAIAFDENVVALDGNLRRVLARLIDLDLDPRSPEGEARLMACATSLLPTGQASAFNQALMDLGATICLPRSPACGACPIVNHCQAFASGTQLDRPIRKRRAPLPFVRRVCAIFERGGAVLIRLRPEGGLLGGMWEFPGMDLSDGQDLEEGLRHGLKEALGLNVEISRPLGVYRQSYTHYHVAAHAFHCDWDESETSALECAPIRWVDITQLEDSPMGKIDRSIANDLNEARTLGVVSHNCRVLEDAGSSEVRSSSCGYQRSSSCLWIRNVRVG
ncbi:MAG TPA: A/G-specific adenine glycosylase [Anaerolineales bacterium]|nr:A/G-specific adenine glycosylase [Anaerolineales bacterium]